MKFFYRYREQSGKWCTWKECSAAALRHYQNDPDVDTKVET